MAAPFAQLTDTAWSPPLHPRKKLYLGIHELMRSRLSFPVLGYARLWGKSGAFFRKFENRMLRNLHSSHSPMATSDSKYRDRPSLRNKSGVLAVQTNKCSSYSYRSDVAKLDTMFFLLSSSSTECEPKIRGFQDSGTALVTRKIELMLLIVTRQIALVKRIYDGI